MKENGKMICLILLVCLLFSVTSQISGFASDEKWPVKAITINAGFGPGGTTDIVNRILGNLLGKELGVPVICGNVTGGASSVLCAQMATKKPDGYEFGLVAVTALTAMPHMRDLPYNSDSFSYVAMLAPDPMDIVVLKDSPYNTFEDLIAAAKAKPNEITYTHTGKGLYDHLVIEWIAFKKDLKFTDAPAPSGPECMALVIGKHVNFGSGSGSHVPQVRDGKMRVLLQTDNGRRWEKETRNIPDVFGVDSPISTSRIIIAPKGVPENIIKKLQTAIQNAIKDPSYVKLLERFYIDNEIKTDNLKGLIEKQQQEIGPVIKAIGLSK